MAVIAVDKEEFVRKCEEVYRRNKTALEREHAGRVVALTEEGVAGVGRTTQEAYREAMRTFPGKVFYCRRIGKFSAADYVF